MCEVILIAGVSSPRSRVRVWKTYDTLRHFGIDVRFWGWDRHGDLPVGEQRCQVIHSQEISSGKASLWSGYLNWARAVWKEVSKAKRSGWLIAVGLESVLPALAARRGDGSRILFDNPDNFFMSRPWPPPLREGFRAAEWTALRSCRATVVPHRSRMLFPDHPRYRVIKNHPTSQDLDSLRGRPTRSHPNRPFTVLVTGRLRDARGSGWIEQVAARLVESEPSIKFVVAGDANELRGSGLLKLVNVDYRGRLMPADALALYNEADVCLTFYDPALEINRYAAPNKWGDCIALACPMVVNREIETADELLAVGGAIQVEYGNVQELVAALRHLNRDRSAVESMKRGLAGLAWEPWDEAWESLLRTAGVLGSESGTA